MTVRELRDILKDFPDNYEVKINYHTYDNLSWEEEKIDEVILSYINNIVFLCGEDKEIA